MRSSHLLMETRTLTKHHKSILLKFYNSVFCFLSTYEVTSQSHAVLSMSKRQGWWCLFSYWREIDKCNQLPCASKILSYLITFISVWVLVKSGVLPKQEETEMNGKSHGIMSQYGVFQKALPDKWSNGTMIVFLFCFFNKGNCPAEYVRINSRCDFKNNRKFGEGFCFTLHAHFHTTKKKIQPWTT